MSVKKLDTIDRTVQKTYIWLKEIQEELHIPDQQFAYQALRAVLHTLRDRLGAAEAANLGAQLPMLIRGIYFEGWKPTGKPDTIRHKEEFLQRVSDMINHAINIPPERITTAVFHVLEQNISRGEIEDVKNSLPRQWNELWAQRQPERQV